MTSILKAQIVKHLAKIFKNLSPDSLNLSTLRGQCALHNLELNESVLMDMLEFPVWLNLKKAVCNKAFINVPWTKIKSQPVLLILDQVYIEIETCENFRQNTNYFTRLSNTNSGKYGFGEKVIDDVKIKIDSVEVRFVSNVFTANLCLLQIFVESRSPNFKQLDNTSKSKIKNSRKNQILLFKYIEWSSLRFEARSESIKHSSPLRLITRNGSCKITLKKNLLDCSTISARLILNFDDLLWILTDSTILSAIHLLMYITELINKSPMCKKNFSDLSSPKSHLFKEESFNQDTNLDALFNKFDIIETSLHLIINRLQLHLSDDLNRSSFCPLKEGGGLHIILQKLLIDLYPYHKATSPRNHWLWYTDSSANRENFLMRHLKTFFTLILEESNYSNLFSNTSNIQVSEMDKKLKDLLSLTILLRIGDYKINCVSTSESENKKNKKICKDNLHNVLISTGVLPKDVPAIYIEINQYYYNEPGSNRFSTRLKSPAPTFFMNLAPCNINFDLTTFLWINAFYSSIHSLIVKFTSSLPQIENETSYHFLIEIVLPTFSINFKNLYENETLIKNDYDSLEIKSTQITLTNSINNFNDLEKLNNLLDKMKLNHLFTNNKNYPWMNFFDYNLDFNKLSTNLKDEINKTLIGYHNQFFVLNCQPIWIDFKNSITSSFIDPIPLTLWISLNKEIFKKVKPNENIIYPEISVFCCLPEFKISIDHQNYLFLTRLFERLDYFSNILKSDFLRIQKNESEDLKIKLKSPLVLVMGIIPSLNIFLKLNQYYANNNEFSCNNEIETNSPINSKKSTKLENEETFIKDTKISHTNYDNTLNEIEEKESVQDLIKNKFSFKNIDNNIFSGYFNKLSTEVDDLQDEDTKSTRSDFSIESEKCVYSIDDFEENENLVYRQSYKNEDFKAEEAFEITEDSFICYEDDLIKYQNNFLAKRNSSITYLKLNLKEIAFIQQNKDFISSILLAINQIKLEPYYQVPYQTFENEFKNCYLSENVQGNSIENLVLNNKILARLDTNSIDEKTEFLSAVIQNLDLCQINTKLIDDLSEFILDLEASKVSNVNFVFQNVSLEIKDDRVKLPPILVNLNKIILKRNSSNEVKIYPLTNQNDLLLEHEKILPIKLKKDENNEIQNKSNLELIQEIDQLKIALEHYKQENEKLKNTNLN